MSDETPVTAQELPRTGPAWTGVGPMAGTDPREAAGIVVGECPAQPFLPELPERGLGADLLGRTGALLADLPVDVSTRTWRLADARGRAGRRAADLLDRDSDALEEAWERAQGVSVGDASAGPGAGPLLQVRVVGPWSLSAVLELPGGRPVLTDSGARRDVAASLAEGVAFHVGRLASRRGARTRVVLDEPELWRVVAGTVPGVSELDPVAAVPADRVGLALRRFADTLRFRGVDEVVVRGPGRSVPDAPASWEVLTETARGESPLDGLAVRAADLVPRSGESADEETHRTLDAVGTVLGDGGLIQLEGPHLLAGPTGDPGVEQVAVAVFGLLGRLAAPRYSTLGRLTFAPTPEETIRSGPSAVAALARARRLAEAAPRLAE